MVDKDGENRRETLINFFAVFLHDAVISPLKDETPHTDR